MLTWACVCSNSSSFILFDTGTWNTDMLATLLHSVLTLAIATMASSLVSKQLKAKSSNFSSKGYKGTSGWNPCSQSKKPNCNEQKKILNRLVNLPRLRIHGVQLKWHKLVHTVKSFLQDHSVTMKTVISNHNLITKDYCF